MIFPQWTKKYSIAESGRDHLGYEYVGVMMLENLLPGISNITYRARYFSFFCWVLYSFYNNKKIKKTATNFRFYLNNKSMVYLYANALNHLPESNTGIDGINLVRQTIENKNIHVFKWTDEDIRTFTNNYWIYSQKMRQLGLSADNPEYYKLESLTDPRGKDPAMAFENSIKNTSYFKNHFEKNEKNIPKDVLLELGKAGGVLELENSPNERQILLETIFRMDFSPDHEGQYLADGTAKSRTESLLLYLDIIKQTKADDFTEKIFQKILYFTKIQDLGYKPMKKLNNVLECWRIFMARQYLVYAIETIFSAITEIIYKKNINYHDLIDLICEQGELKFINHKYKINIDYGQKLSAIINQLSKGEESSHFDQHHTLKNLLNEENLWVDIKLKGDLVQSKSNIEISILILIVLYLRLNHYRQNKSLYWQFAQTGEQDNLSIDTFFTVFQDCLAEDITLKQFIDKFIKKHIILRHYSVAMDKLSWYKNDTFHFFYDQEILRGERIARPNVNAAKFTNTLNFLYDLGLITKVKNKYQVTASGQQILKKHGIRD